MMHRVPFILLGAPLQKREIGHPEKIKLCVETFNGRGTIGVGDFGNPRFKSRHLALISLCEVGFAQNFAGDVPFVGGEQDQIAFRNF